MNPLLATPLLTLWLAPQDPATLNLLTKDGQKTRAQVISIDHDEAVLKVMALGGSMQVKRALADFTPASAFLIEEAAATADNYDGHFALARKAGEYRLLGPAGKHARAAVKASEGKADAEQKIGAVRKWAADTLEGMVDEAIVRGDIDGARHALKILSTRLADQRTEEQLDALAAKIEGLKGQKREKAHVERQAKMDQKQKDDIQRKLDPIEKAIATGDKLLREAISKSRQTSASANTAERSIQAYKSAWKNLQDLQAKYPDDAQLASEFTSLSEHMHDNAIEAALHAANVLTVQSDYKGAMEWANKVLAFDPECAEAKEMVRTIQVAAAAASGDWGWGWGAVGGSVGGGVVGGRPQVDPRR